GLERDLVRLAGSDGGGTSSSRHVARLPTFFGSVRQEIRSTGMDGNGDVSVFIGMLPGAGHRQLVLFPEGQVLADLRECEIQTGGYAGSDRGMSGASSLIGLLRLSGWYVDEMPHAGAVWMKPPREESIDGDAG